MPTIENQPHRACDICGNASSTLLYPQRFAQLDDSSTFAGYDVVTCDRCGFVFADLIPDQGSFDRYYREMSKYEASNDFAISATALSNYRRIASDVATRIPNRSARVLDIGAASGQLLAAFKELGYSEIVGLDPSPRCAQIARERYGVTVIDTPISQMTFDGRFDLVLLSAVLEHLRDLPGTVARFAELLNPGGSIWIEVPDASRFAKFNHAPFQQLSLEHINFFTPASLSALMSAGGFSSTDVWQPIYHLSDVDDPALDGLFRKTEAGVAPPRYDTEGVAAIRQYITDCQKEESAICDAVHHLVESQTPILIWGTGSLTLHLLENPRFRALNVASFVDSNPNYRGKTIRSIPVLGPGDLGVRAEPILVVSRLYEGEIAANISQKLNLPNDVIKLFADLVQQSRPAVTRY